MTAAALMQGCGDSGTGPPGGSPGVATVEILPEESQARVGDQYTLAAAAFDSAGHPVPQAVFTWSSLDPTVVAVTATAPDSGRVAAIGSGTGRVVATSGVLADTNVVTVAAAPPPAVATLIAAGDIASCASDGDSATAALVDHLEGTIAALGDNAYWSGSSADYRDCYAPTWGRFKSRTRPTPGNHDYYTQDAAGYFAYFGAAAGDPATGYYSYDLGAWHVVVLNSNLDMAAGSTQEQWLRADLAAHPAACTLAYWHHPRFSSGAKHGNDPATQPLWQALYDAGADVVLNGHEHDYERFGPQTPTGTADSARGIREFVVGTGGESHYPLGTRKANSEVYDNATFGVLVLTLREGGYDWRFAPVAGRTFSDAGSGSCH